MDNYNIFLHVEFLATVFRFSVIFSLTWLPLYVVIGTWVKGQFSVPEETENRYKPIFASHLLFSVLFMNPWVMLIVLMKLNSLGFLSTVFFCIIPFLYVWLFSVTIDFVSMRILPKWKRLTWMAYKPSVGRYIWIQTALVLAGVLLGYGVAHFFVVMR